MYVGRSFLKHLLVHPHPQSQHFTRHDLCVSLLGYAAFNERILLKSHSELVASPRVYNEALTFTYGHNKMGTASVYTTLRLFWSPRKIHLHCIMRQKGDIWRIRSFLLVSSEETGKSVLCKLTREAEHKVICSSCLSPCGLHSKNTLTSAVLVWGPFDANAFLNLIVKVLVLVCFIIQVCRGSRLQNTSTLWSHSIENVGFWHCFNGLLFTLLLGEGFPSYGHRHGCTQDTGHWSNEINCSLLDPNTHRPEEGDACRQDHTGVALGNKGTIRGCGRQDAWHQDVSHRTRGLACLNNSAGWQGWAGAEPGPFDKGGGDIWPEDFISRSSAGRRTYSRAIQDLSEFTRCY